MKEGNAHRVGEEKDGKIADGKGGEFNHVHSPPSDW